MRLSDDMALGRAGVRNGYPSMPDTDVDRESDPPKSHSTGCGRAVMHQQYTVRPTLSPERASMVIGSGHSVMQFRKHYEGRDAYTPSSDKGLLPLLDDY